MDHTPQTVNTQQYNIITDCFFCFCCLLGPPGTMMHVSSMIFASYLNNTPLSSSWKSIVNTIYVL